MRNKYLSSKYINQQCISCGRSATEMDHIKHYGGNPDRDCIENLWPICRSCHVKKHAEGLNKFVVTNKLDQVLKQRGFYFCFLSSKWRHPKF